MRWLFCAVLARREAMLRLREPSRSAGVMTAGALPELILWLIDGRGATSRPVAAGALLVLVCCVMAGRCTSECASVRAIVAGALLVLVCCVMAGRGASVPAVAAGALLVLAC